MPIGSLYIISAPSGAGKTSLISELIKQDAEIKVAISHTTRPARPGEEEGKHYHFTQSDDFKTKIDQGHFLEYAQVFGHYYGTSNQAIDTQLESNHDVILEIDWQGAQQVRKLRSDAISIFILPPSVEALKQRLSGRKQDSQAVIKTRLQQACDDMSYYPEFDYLVINDNFDTAVTDLASIFQCERLKLAKQQQRHQEFLMAITTES
ncbi:MAG: guanylate kinase [Cocleimonas sp.]|nr:guanylate kinase [Cocleimonas sp.]